MSPATGGMRLPRRRRRTLLAWTLDALVVVVFVAVGRSSHEEGAGGIVTTALPFLAALQTGWLVTSGSDRLLVRPGALIWLMTVGLGLSLRVGTGDTAAPGFIVVTSVVLAVGLLGWRAVAALIGRRRGRPRGGMPSH